jgi:beta-lactamase class A
MRYALTFLILICIGEHSYSQTLTGKKIILLESIKKRLAEQKGTFAVAYKNMQTGETILLNEHEQFHAASTMKTPVMIEIYKQVASGTLKLKDTIIVKNEFKSIVDGSLYQLNPVDDSEQELYKQVGKGIPMTDLVYQMIINSSNLATNMMMELVDGKNVTQSMRELGAPDIQVLRGVEDGKAFAKGLNNTTTAFDLMMIYDKLAMGNVVSEEACSDMIKVLLDQKHNTLIPAFLPKEVKVAHKTGTITGVHHDSGIVLLPNGNKYVLVILSKGLENDTVATEAMARVSELIYLYTIGN